MRAKPRLLFLAPYLPDPRLGGAAVRAHAHLSILSRHFDVVLVVLSSHPTRSVDDIPADIRQSVRRILFHRIDEMPRRAHPWRRLVDALPLGRLLRGLSPRPELFHEYFSDALACRVGNDFKDRSFDAVHAFRIATLPALRHVLRNLAQRPSRIVLDLDDLESKTALRRARALGTGMGRQLRLLHRLDVPKVAALERQCVKLADAVCLCSTLDRDEFNRRYATTKAAAIPNTVGDPGEPGARDAAANKDVLLFVGNFHFRPNVDAVVDFLANILPLLRLSAPRPFAVKLVGRAAAGFEYDRAANHEVELHGDVPDLRPFYREAAVVLAPIRSGGGTRIKIIEALSYGRPVVSTRIGAEGLGVTDGRDILLRDTPRDFAEACAALLRDRDLSGGVGDAGRRLYLEKYNPAAVEKALVGLYRIQGLSIPSLPCRRAVPETRG